MAFNILGLFGTKKQIEPARIAMIRDLENKVGSLTNKNTTAMQKYVETIEYLQKEKYDVSSYTAKVDMYRPFLKK